MPRGRVHVPGPCTGRGTPDFATSNFWSLHPSLDLVFPRSPLIDVHKLLSNKGESDMNDG
jgi:hypothetical protein